MGGLFTKAADDAARALSIAAAAGAAVFVLLLLVLARSPACTQQQSQPLQPVKLDHRHHVRDDGVDCLYCHESAMTTRLAGVPATSVCLGCHAQVWTDSKELAPLHESFATHRALHWKRVTSLPDFVFFDHHAHTERGVGCSTCHGRVDLMPEVTKAEPLTMGFCLDCHRHPEAHLRPQDRITDMDWRDDVDVGRKIARQLRIAPTTDCTGCHR